MFHDCSSLLSISENFSKLDTNHIKDMNSIFYNCSSLEYLPDISKWDTENVLNMKEMDFDDNSYLATDKNRVFVYDLNGKEKAEL